MRCCQLRIVVGRGEIMSMMNRGDGSVLNVRDALDDDDHKAY